MPGDATLHRRELLKSIGAAGAAAGVLGGPAIAAEAPGPHHHPVGAPAAGAEPLRWLTTTEAATLEAVVDTLIPKDAVGPGGVEAGIVTFIDRELAAGFGRGARMYLQGPFAEGAPEQGYQLPLTPAELYRVGLADLEAWVGATRGGKSFDRLAPAERSAALKEVEAGKAEFANVPSRVFFELLLTNAMEGYFGDPMYGGNRDKAVWRMIGFPGVGTMYAELIEEYRNKPYVVEPQSIADLT
jgi:gluconate 2-dehydrogenase gamma chain